MGCDAHRVFMMFAANFNPHTHVGCDSTKVNPMVEEMKPEEAATPVEQQQPDYTGIAKALVAELSEKGMLNTTPLEKSCEEKEDKKEEEEKKEDEYKKSLDAQAGEIASLKKSLEELTEKYNTLSKAVERIDNEPLNKATAYAIQNGNVVTVPLNDMQKAMTNVASVDPFKAALVKMRSE